MEMAKLYLIEEFRHMNEIMGDLKKIQSITGDHAAEFGEIEQAFKDLKRTMGSLLQEQNEDG